MCSSLYVALSHPRSFAPTPSRPPLISRTHCPEERAPTVVMTAIGRSIDCPGVVSTTGRARHSLRACCRCRCRAEPPRHEAVCAVECAHDRSRVVLVGDPSIDAQVLFGLHCWWGWLLTRILIKIFTGKDGAHKAGEEEYEGVSDDDEPADQQNITRRH